MQKNNTLEKEKCSDEKESALGEASLWTVTVLRILNNLLSAFGFRGLPDLFQWLFL